MLIGALKVMINKPFKKKILYHFYWKLKKLLILQGQWDP